MNEKLFEAYKQEQIEHHGECIEIVTSLPRLLAVIGALQLACRHPNFASGPVRRSVDYFIAAAIANMQTSGFAASAQVAAMGNDPNQDLPA